MTSLVLDHSVVNFFRRRWLGEVCVRTLFWWDTLAVGTVINAWVTVLSLIFLAKGLDVRVWLLFYFAVIPYNLFLVISVWRHPQSSHVFQTVTLCWLGLTLMV